jgi:low affinity Fe/Cu permease
VIWALILVWAGVVFLASNLGWLDSLLRRTSDIPGMGFLTKLVDAWPVVLIGAGVILLGEVVARLVMPAYRGPVTGTAIFAVILIAIGLGDLVNWNLLWPIILIALGLSVLLRGLKRSSPG